MRLSKRVPISMTWHCRSRDILGNPIVLKMVQSAASSSSAPSTPSDSGNPITSRTISDSASFLPDSQSKSSTQPFGFLRSFQRSPSYPPYSRRLADPHKSLNGDSDWAAGQGRSSQHSALSAPTSKYEERGSITKRHSHRRHTNIYTECGRHSDDWLFGGFSMTETVKRMLGKKRED